MANKPVRTAIVDYGANFSGSFTAHLKRSPGIAEAVKLFIAHKSERPPRMLPRGMRDHTLNPPFEGFRECHLAGDSCLLYTDAGGVVTLVEIVTHDELMGPKAKAVAKRNATYRG